MDHCKELYARWLAQPALDDAVRQELAGIADDDAAITDRFYRDLEFGTGGLRGVIGAGTNRMNLYTVRKATQGLADYLNASDLPKKVAIATTAAIMGSCSPARLPVYWQPTASRPICTPGWNPPRRFRGRCGISAAALAFV